MLPQDERPSQRDPAEVVLKTTVPALSLATMREAAKPPVQFSVKPHAKAVKAASLPKLSVGQKYHVRAFTCASILLMGILTSKILYHGRRRNNSWPKLSV